MPLKDPAAKRTAAKAYYKAHPEMNAAMRRRSRQKRIDYVMAAKQDKPCADCGGTFPSICMDFDHLRDKVMDVGKLARHGCSIARLQTEIDKCELVCANCHRIRTHERSQYHSAPGKES